MIHPSYRAKMIAFSVFQGKQLSYIQDFQIKEAKKKSGKRKGGSGGNDSYEQLLRIMK
jgi:hypothetical protein